MLQKPGLRLRHISDKEFIYRIYKNSYNSIWTRQPNCKKKKKIGEVLDKHFSSEFIQMSNKHIKDTDY